MLRWMDDMICVFIVIAVVRRVVYMINAMGVVCTSESGGWL